MFFLVSYEIQQLKQVYSYLLHLEEGWKHTPKTILFLNPLLDFSHTQNSSLMIPFFLKGYFFNLHFKCYPLSWFPLLKLPIPSLIPLLLWGCSLTHPLPSHLSPPWHSPTLGHRAFTGPRSSPPIDVWQGHPLLHKQLEPWVSPCVLFGKILLPAI